MDWFGVSKVTYVLCFLVVHYAYLAFIYRHFLSIPRYDVGCIDFILYFAVSSTALHSAQTLSTLMQQAMPAVAAYRGKIILIKYGGNAMTDPALQQAFAHDVVLLHTLGIYPVVVHGGGPQIEQALQALGKQAEFIQGMRVTDAETMRVVQWVLAGEVQQSLVGLLNQAGGLALGFTGRDSGMIQASKMQVADNENPDTLYDIGQVGIVRNINPEPIYMALDAGYIPVISPIGMGEDNRSYNVNADVAAAALAVALEAEKLLLLTNIAGVLDKSGNLITHLDAAQIDTLCADGTISGGMIPKITGALDAAQQGVHAVHILDGRVPHGMLQDLLLGQPCGTMIQS